MNVHRRTLALGVGLWVLSAAAPVHGAGASPDEQIVHDDPFAGFKFPRRIAGYTFQNIVRYPRVGLGYGVNYVDRTGTTATIMVYDLNTTGFPDGTTEPGVRQQLEEIDASIAATAKQMGYQSVSRVDNVQPLSKAWLQVNHELVRPDGRRAHAYSFLRAQSGKYVKIRVTANSNASYSRLPMFLLGVSRAIGMMNGQAPPSP